MFTSNHDRAKIIGILVHFMNGWLLSLIYVAAFHAWGIASWWLGASVGLVHALFVLTVGMSFFPGMHARMANEQYGPTVVRQLEPHCRADRPLHAPPGRRGDGAPFGRDLLATATTLSTASSALSPAQSV
jgi:hypothetical protein